VENTAQGDGLLSEHGISFWIEYGDQKLMFDTGQTGIVIRNAEILGINIADTDAIVISHGHYDHTGGLNAVGNIAKKAKVYIHPNAIDKKYSFRSGSGKFVGIPDGSKKVIESHNNTDGVVWTKEPTEIFPGLFVTGQIPRINNFEVEGQNFFLDENAKQPDSLPDDQSVFFNTKDGLVVIFGCAHAGVINTLDYITKISGIKNVHTIMGGFHLVGSGKSKISKVIDSLERFGIQRIGPGHCTGTEAVLELEKQYPKRCFMCSVGTNCEFQTI
jgi:7,8-dihydropterin-6-yl-methyl-4-(beta-D-ribofuranosyl)aminobenzene 5'-phosphate synthase